MADGDILERLVVQFDADVDKLLAKMSGASRTVHGYADDWEKRFGSIDLSAGINRSLNAASLSVLSQATGQIGALGAGLEALGPLGLGAAAAIAAVGGAVEEAKSAADWAAALATSAKEIGTTTTALQEFDHVLTAAGVPIDTGRESLKHLNEVLGQMQDNLAKGQIKKAFQDIGFTADQLRGYSNANDLLPQLIDHINKLGTESERAGVEARLGISNLAPVIEQGAASYQRLIDQAHQYGIVVDADVVKQSAAAAEQMRVASEVIDINLKSAFASLAPVTADAATAIAQAAKAVGDLVKEIGDALGPLAQLVEKLKQIPGLQGAAGIGGAIGLATNPFLGLPAIGFLGAKPGLDMMAQAGRNVQLQNQVQALLAGHDPTTHDDIYGAGGTPTGGVPSAGRKSRGDAAGALKAAQDKLDQANKQLDSAQAALTTNILDRADAEKRAVDAELKRQTDGLAADAQKAVNDKSLSAAQRAHILAELAAAGTADEAAATAKKQKIDQDALAAYDDQALAFKQEINRSYSDIAGIQASLATTSAERNKIEQDNLAQNQLLDRQALDEKTRNLVAQAKTDQDRQIAEQEGAQRRQALLDVQKAQGDQLAHQQQGPVGDYLDQLLKSTDTGVGTTEVDALKSLNQGLVDAITNGKSLKDVLGGVFKTIETDLVNLAIEKFLTIPLAQALNLMPGSAVSSTGAGSGLGIFSLFSGLGHLFGFADGTSSAPGGLSLVGEKGPELVNLPAGSQVIPNSSLKGASVKAGMGVASVTNMFSFDLTGALVTEDLLASVNASIAASHQSAVAQGAALGAQAARQLIPGEMARRSALAFR